MKVRRKDSYLTTPWKGGTTTELYIHPAHSHYKDRDFQFRLSTATVEVPESDFTHLPGVSRKLMILDGEIEIIHENQYSRDLDKYDIEEFPGEWITKSKGKCTDFNLMTRENISGTIQYMTIRYQEIRSLAFQYQTQFYFVYLMEGIIRITYERATYVACKNDLVVVENPESSVLNVEAIENSDFVIVEIF